MDAFAQMAETLSKRQEIQGRNRTALMREHLRHVGRANAEELARIAGVSSNLVRPLLKYDINAGRIRITGAPGSQIYLAAQNPPPDAPTIRAMNLLFSHGYVVSRPTQKAAP